MKNAKCHLEKTSSLSTAPWPQQTLPSSKQEILSATSRFKWAKAQISRGLEIKKNNKFFFACVIVRLYVQEIAENVLLQHCAHWVRIFQSVQPHLVQRRLAVGQGPDSPLTQTSFAAKGGPIKYRVHRNEHPFSENILFWWVLSTFRFSETLNFIYFFPYP